KLGGETLAGQAAAAFWQSLREQTHPFFGGDAAIPLWRLSLPSVTPPLDLPGTPLIEWGGAQRWLRGGDATTVRAAAARAGGHATLFRGDARGNGVFQPLAPPLAQIHRRLKAAFDPHGVFNPGRMYPEF
ncbi:MAG: glycolate oxidase subunit GlcE, partial [Proteobacteria bacterium]|nr:glycolate oxidase subunit GlcE [Pseudomonadota bacterium]